MTSVADTTGDAMTASRQQRPGGADAPETDATSALEADVVGSRRFARVDLEAWRRLAPGRDADALVLGGLGYGDDLPESAGRTGIGPLPAARLMPPAARIDAWLARAPVHRGASGALAWRHDGHWLYGAIELDESVGRGLEVLAREAYEELFATLADTGFGHLIRVWNHLPRINADGGGMERYRQFNAGRQAAFLAAGQASFEGAPAACAIGVSDGPLGVRFLAGRQAPVALENPRQVSAYHYPVAYGPRSPTFSRAALAQASAGETGRARVDDGETDDLVGDPEIALFVSGTASIVGHETRHANDVRAQTRETLANLRAVLAASQERTTARFDLGALTFTVYVRRAVDVEAIGEELALALGPTCDALAGAVMVEADICRSDLLVEIEAHGFARGRLLPT